MTIDALPFYGMVSPDMKNKNIQSSCNIYYMSGGSFIGTHFSGIFSYWFCKYILTKGEYNRVSGSNGDDDNNMYKCPYYNSISDFDPHVNRLLIKSETNIYKSIGNCILLIAIFIICYRFL